MGGYPQPLLLSDIKVISFPYQYNIGRVYCTINVPYNFTLLIRIV